MNERHIPDTDRTIQGLLGPAGPELYCDECFEKLDEYVDLELRGRAADAEVPGMRSHLEGCPACHEEYESLRELVRRGASS
jgi:anti-sigma factor RsiW